MAKTKAITIPKGKMVYVSIKTLIMQDKRFFTKANKLNAWLKFIRKNNLVYKVRFKEFRIN